MCCVCIYRQLSCKCVHKFGSSKHPFQNETYAMKLRSTTSLIIFCITFNLEKRYYNFVPNENVYGRHEAHVSGLSLTYV